MTPDDDKLIADDVRTLHRLGYAQELARCLGAFSNFAISLSIICILAGGVTSFHVAFCSVGGAAIGLGWPIVALFALIVAAAMGQIASAFPTAGGLYHWASILGGRGWGWFTAWFNLAGLVTVLAAINMGTLEFANRAFFDSAEPTLLLKLTLILTMAASQALVNHVGIRVTARLTDFSGYLIFVVALALTIALLVYAPNWDWSRLVTFTNYGGLPVDESVWPTAPTPWLFVLGFLLPAYTITGFDASAHAAEETVGADRRVPRGIVGAVLVSGLAGWVMLCAFVLAIPNLDEAATSGPDVFYAHVIAILPLALQKILCVGILGAQYLCGLATVTSASRMAFAFARDGGLPGSAWLRHVSPTSRTPVYAIWAAALAAVLFTVYTPVYETIAVVCTIFLYISYALPIGLGCLAHGRSWTRMGPWQLGVWYRPFALISILGCAGLIALGFQPPNEIAIYVVGFMTLALIVMWTLFARHRFAGPPHGVLSQHRLDEIHAAEDVVHQSPISE
ncbi:MAG: amino acid permease [Planctomycetes bacterium]|nr:amino acid permease [Planctomycetota bacterium]